MRGFQRDVTKYISEIETLKFVETFPLKKEEEKSEEKESNQESQPQQEQVEASENKE